MAQMTNTHRKEFSTEWGRRELHLPSFLPFFLLLPLFLLLLLIFWLLLHLVMLSSELEPGLT